jgi:hypothetical protein
MDQSVMQQALKALLDSRFHGAVNIHGIQYQLLYSILQAFTFCREAAPRCSIRLEGIEDADLVGLRQDNAYIQVKTSEKPWHWSQLEKPLRGFLPVFRATPTASFVLAVNFPLRNDIEQFAQRSSLPAQKRHQIERKFQTLCRQVGASVQEATGLTEKVTIVSLSEEHLWRDLRQVVAATFELGSHAVEVYILVLGSQEQTPEKVRLERWSRFLYDRFPCKNR